MSGPRGNGHPSPSSLPSSFSLLASIVAFILIKGWAGALSPGFATRRLWRTRTRHLIGDFRLVLHAYHAAHQRTHLAWCGHIPYGYAPDNWVTKAASTTIARPSLTFPPHRRGHVRLALLCGYAWLGYLDRRGATWPSRCSTSPFLPRDSAGAPGRSALAA